MPNQSPSQQDASLVAPQVFAHAQEFPLRRGGKLSGFELVYETYGELNPKRDNAVLVCPALSGWHHAAGWHSPDDRRPGWWNDFIGPGLVIDTKRFFVVSLSNLGTCFGSSGPLTENPATGKPWGMEFPQLTVVDWVASQALLADYLKIDCWHAVVGGSLGGMQVMRWMVDYSHRISRAVVIAAATKLSAQNIAFNKVACSAIERDPNFHGGRYAEHEATPSDGLALARMVGHLTYMSAANIDARFGRDVQFNNEAQSLVNAAPKFQVSSYLEHQGSSFAEQFDANSYLLLIRMMEEFDIAGEHPLAEVFAEVKSEVLVVSFSSDWRFSPKRSREIVDALLMAKKPVSYIEVESDKAHDSFLFCEPDYTRAVSAFLERN